MEFWWLFFKNLFAFPISPKFNSNFLQTLQPVKFYSKFAQILFKILLTFD